MLNIAATWWNGATVGTRLFTRLRGQEVGADEAGNRYYRTRDDQRRWVVFGGEAEASRVPPDWRAWLHGTIAAPPSESPLPQKPWEQPHLDNRTGLAEAWRPPGSLHGAARRPAATGDYEAWTPPPPEGASHNAP